MIVQIQYYVDGTGDLSPNRLLMLHPNYFTIEELFNRIHAGSLLLFGLF